MISDNNFPRAFLFDNHPYLKDVLGAINNILVAHVYLSKAITT